MRNLKSIIITLAASTAILIPAASAAASTTSTSTAGSSSLSATTSSLGCVVLCFDLYDNDVLSGNDVDITTAVNFCGVQLGGVLVGQWMDCGNGKKVHRKR